jgi:UDP-4-amino-4,6-dideoxy-N-acetyl-beta-L-altrosamine N-acetyltransferase
MMARIGECALRPMTRDDLPLVMRWRNRPRIRDVMFARHEIGWDEHVAWFERVASSPASRQMIFEIAGRPVGVVGLDGIGGPDGVATWGFYLGETDRPRGSGARMLALALDMAFTEMGVRKMCSEVLAFNEASIETHARLGFKREGLLREQRIREDQSGDVVLFALFADEWATLRPGVLDALSCEGGDEPRED